TSTSVTEAAPRHRPRQRRSSFVRCRHPGESDSGVCCASPRPGYHAATKASRRNRMSSLSGKHGPRYRHLAAESEPYETIAVEKLTPIIGAEITGVEIGKLVSEEAPSNRQMDEIHRALAENLVIFFRDQHITPAQHLAFGRKFGELHIHP